MAFSSRRGRPKTTRTHLQRDRGTEELRRHRAALQTAEPLDLLFKHGMISEQEHQAGLHFRWLHTLCFGIPSPRSFTLSITSIEQSRSDDPAWRSAREAEYRAASRFLQNLRLLYAVQGCCLYQDWPHTPTQLEQIKKGLSWLEQYWRECRSTTKADQYSS